jgi:hypothetical protein
MAITWPWEGGSTFLGTGAFRSRERRGLERLYYLGVRFEQPAQVILAEADHVIQALPPSRANHPLRKGLPVEFQSMGESQGIGSA